MERAVIIVCQEDESDELAKKAWIQILLLAIDLVGSKLELGAQAVTFMLLKTGLLNKV